LLLDFNEIWGVGRLCTKKSRFNFGNDLEHILDILEIIILSHRQQSVAIQEAIKVSIMMLPLSFCFLTVSFAVHCDTVTVLNSVWRGKGVHSTEPSSYDTTSPAG